MKIITLTLFLYLTLTDANGCADVDSITVFVEESCGMVDVPNIFSPNEDGKNDVLFVRGKCIQTLSFAIYDRWGEKIFETTEKSIGWNGTFNGNPLNPDVFVYYIKATFITGGEKMLKGNVTLVR